MEVNQHCHTPRKNWAVSTKSIRTRVYMAELEATIRSADHLMSLIKEAYYTE